MPGNYQKVNTPPLQKGTNFCSTSVELTKNLVSNIRKSNKMKRKGLI